jgi:hypothetical protein
MDELKPKSDQEAVAVFRHGVLGAVTQAKLDKGELRAALSELSKKTFLPPRSKTTKRYGVSTLERWYYAYQHRLLSAPSSGVAGPRHARWGMPVVED